MNRRLFFKRAGASTLAVVAAPLFIPAGRLGFGVPTQRLAASAPVAGAIDLERRLADSGFVTWDDIHEIRGCGNRLDANEMLSPFVFDAQAFLEIVSHGVKTDTVVDDFTEADWRQVAEDTRAGQHFFPVTKEWFPQSRLARERG